MRHFRARQPVLVLAVLWFVLYRDHTGVARVGLLAALLHEAGHTLAWLAMTRRLPVFRFSLAGVGLDVFAARLTRRQTFLLALAGPLTNFLLLGVTLWRIQIAASYWGYFFAAANLITGAFNLLPVGRLDGRRMLECLLP